MAWLQLQPQPLLMALSLLTQPLLPSIASQPASQPCLLPGLKQVKVSSFLFSSHLPYLTQEAAANHCDPGETCGSRALRIIGKVGWGKRGPGPFKHRVSARTLPG